MDHVCVCQSPGSRFIHACGVLAVGVSECQGRGGVRVGRGDPECRASGGAADTLFVSHNLELSTTKKKYTSIFIYVNIYIY